MLSLEDLTKLIDAGEIDTVVIAGTDMQGRLYGKRLSARHFLKAGVDGVHTCSVVLGWGQDHSLDPGYEFTGWDTGYPDFVSHPDMATLRLCAWQPRTAIVLADARSLDGGPVTVSPRAVLAKILEKVRTKGLIPYAASELELYLLQETAQSSFDKGYVNLATKHPVMHPETVVRSSEDEHYVGELRRDR